ncbi:MAG: sulfatase-like hydrolase/transferase [Verrucomicrobia bacterium]|nr:sulfatase-like hydrolase/transferase [Verrucomicrobiota bacterium]MDA1067125.1 sulfatase-like hydrolase/transferase [Verrucomicrobiota bacterium]
MRKRAPIVLRVTCLFFTLLGLAATYAAEKTNVVFILTDNHGAWTLGCYGNPDIRTPHIDRMAAEGIRFSHAFANNAVCSPTRATYLTGLMPSQHGVHNFLTAGRLQVGPDARNTLEHFTSLPEILKAEGYKCGLVGKWHLGDNLHPQEGLEDYWITMPHGGTNTFHNAQVIENGETRNEPTYLTQLWTDNACNFIETNKDDPFFLYLAYNGPYGLSGYQLESSGNQHANYYADKSLSSFPGGVIHPWQFSNRQYFGNPVSIRRYAEELSAIDDGVGAVLQKLKELGLDENTLVVFAADQGWAGGQHGLWGMGDHTRPVNAFEHSMQIPLILRHPSGKDSTRQKIPGGRVSDHMVSNYDFMPSILSYLGLKEKTPDSPQSPGRDYSGILRGETMSDWDDTVFYEYESLRCIRTRDWKYIERFEDGYDELYHLAEDPGEQQNLIYQDSVAAIKQELQSRLNQFFSDNASPEYDLWNGGASQTRYHVWGKETVRGQTGNHPSTVQVLPAVDLSVTVPEMTLPEGLIAEVAAAPPLTRHPMMGNFDDRGRLFVAEAAGLNLKASVLDVEKPNFIRMLVDNNQDGLFDHSTVFAKDLTFPSGTLWHDGALWVTAAPSIWRLEDTDDDGVADKREEIVNGFGYTGNAADLHGPFLHPNGRIFWCHGRKDLDVHDKNGNLIHKGKGARIWSCEPDGSDVQIYAGGGMDNPVEIVFTPEGEIIGDINLMYGRPRGDTLVHWQYGGAYPRYDQETVLEEFTRTGDLLKEFHNFGHVAVSGINLYRSGTILGDYAGNLFTTHFNTQKVTRSVIEKNEATFGHVKEEDFLVIDDPDVHLTDIIEGADGSLLVIDTGGWFRDGCPISQIAKPEIAGAIYRIRNAGVVDQKTDFRGLDIDWSNASPTELAAFLDDPRFAVRDRAIASMAELGNGGVGDLKSVLTNGTVEARRNAIWALTRIGSSEAMELVRDALKDEETTIRHTACNSIWKTRDTHAIKDLAHLLLHNQQAAVQMAAARALGRIGDSKAIEALLKFIERPMDRTREHAAIYALIEINDFGQTKKALGKNLADVQRRSLWALDGMQDSQLGANQVVPFLNSVSIPLQETAITISKLHPEWASDIATAFHQWKNNGDLTGQQKTAVNALVPFYLTNADIQNFVNRIFEAKDGEESVHAFRLISESLKPVKLNERWEREFESALWSAHVETMSLAIDALAKIDTDHFDNELTRIGDNTSHPPLIRIKALGAISQAKGPMSPSAFSMLSQLLAPTSGSLQRLDAAQILSKATFTKEQVREVTELMKTVGPLEIPLLVSIFEKHRDAPSGIALVNALESSAAANVLSPSELQRMLASFPPDVYDRGKPLVKQLFAQEEQREKHLAEVSSKLETGDPTRGKAAFISGKGACITCHQIGNEGHEVGPNLSQIGQIRTKQDLLESILFPSINLARDFESYVIETTDGQSLLGVVQRETADTIFLLDATAVAKPIPRSSIKTIQPGVVSLMPQGLDQTMTQEELIDLVAYLDSLE